MRLLARILILTALSVSIYLAVVSLGAGAIAGCGGGTSCDKILKSDWAYLGHIPVSIPAVGVYGVMLVLLFVRQRWSPLGQVLVIGLVTSIVLTVLWFVGIQVFVLKQICPYCMASHLCGSVGAILYGRSLLNPEKALASGRWPMPGILLGIAATAGFISLQMILPKPDRSVEFAVDTQRIVTGANLAPETTSSESVDPEDMGIADTIEGDQVMEEARVPDASDAVVAPVEVSRIVDEGESLEVPPEVTQAVIEAIPEAAHTIPEAETAGSKPPEEPVPVYSIHGGKFTFPVNDIPGIGDWRSPNIMLNLIDFACDHCREHYRTVRKRAPLYQKEIYFGILPLALNERCNPYFSMPGLPDYSNCQYARLALAVWRMAPDRYMEYVDWLCLESSPPASLEGDKWILAREYAQNLIGTDMLNQGWKDPWVLEMMDTLTELYGYNLKVTGQGAIPQQFLNQKLRFGTIGSESSLDMILGLNFPIEIKRRR